MVNPFDQVKIQTILTRKQKKELLFTKIVVCSYSDNNLDVVTITSHQSDEVGQNEIKDLWRNIVKQAKECGASDIHIVPDNKMSRIGYRIHTKIRYGLAHDILNDIYQRLINLILSKAGINHGSFIDSNSGKFYENDLSLRLETIPTNQYFKDGSVTPKATIRVHQSRQKIRDLDNLGLLKTQVKILKELCAFIGSKIVLLVGPTGSGKTTILYALLKEIQRLKPGVMINTLEDPPEINLVGIVQTPINNKKKTPGKKQLNQF